MDNSPAILKLIGLKVLAIKGGFGKRGKKIDPAYILFDDNKTYINLDTQDCIDYHDFDYCARILRIRDDNPEFWKKLNSDEYPDATTDIGW